MLRLGERWDAFAHRNALRRPVYPSVRTELVEVTMAFAEKAQRLQRNQRPPQPDRNKFLRRYICFSEPLGSNAVTEFRWNEISVLPLTSSVM